MRRMNAYEEYLYQLTKEYRERNLEEPEWIEMTLTYHHMIIDGCRYFSDMCSNSAIPKSEMARLSKLEEVKSTEGVPEEMIINVNKFINILKSMYTELVSHKDIYFINDWTLTKAGRRKMREFTNEFDALQLAYH